MLLLAPRPRHALDATDGPLRGFGCAVSQAGALPMDMQDSTAELLAMGPDVLKVLLHTPLPRLIAQGPSRLFCAAGRSLPSVFGCKLFCKIFQASVVGLCVLT